MTTTWSHRLGLLVFFGRFPRTSRHPESEPTPKGARSLAKSDDDERIFTWNMRRLADDDPVLARAAESSIVRWSSLRDYVWDMRQRITIEMIRELSEARVPLDTRLAALLKTSREPLRDDLVDAMAAWFGIPSPTGDAGRALLIELAIQLHVHIDNPWLASIQDEVELEAPETAMEHSADALPAAYDLLGTTTPDFETARDALTPLLVDGTIRLLDQLGVIVSL